VSCTPKISFGSIVLSALKVTFTVAVLAPEVVKATVPDVPLAVVAVREAGTAAGVRGCVVDGQELACVGAELRTAGKV
jgi:hypothetical protein